MSTRRYGRIPVELTNESKQMYPGGISKLDLVEYYERVADRLLPHLEGRPLTLRRFPDGIEGEGFFQKRRGEYFPDSIKSAAVPSSEADLDQVVCGNRATLIYLVNQGAIELHPLLSRVGSLARPDVAIFDLDPGAQQDFRHVRRAARALKQVLDELGIRCYAKTTGSRGIHVVVPLRAELEFDEVRDLAKAIAETVEAHEPDLATTAVRKNARGGRLFIDILRNGYAQTAVAPYSLRAIPGAPVAMPIAWEALDSDIDARSVTIANIESWLGAPDPWNGMYRRRQSLAARRRTIESLRADASDRGHR